MNVRELIYVHARVGQYSVGVRVVEQVKWVAGPTHFWAEGCLCARLNTRSVRNTKLQVRLPQWMHALIADICKTDGKVVSTILPPGRPVEHILQKENMKKFNVEEFQNSQLNVLTAGCLWATQVLAADLKTVKSQIFNFQDLRIRGDQRDRSWPGHPSSLARWSKNAFVDIRL